MIEKLYFYFSPIYLIVSFFFKVVTGIEFYDIQSYINLFFLLLIIIKFQKNGIYINLLFVLLFIFYVFYFKNSYPISSRASYMLLFLTSLVVFNILSFNPKLYFPSEREIEIFFILFVSLYFISVLFSPGLPDDVITEEERVYLYGFTIPHHFSYIMSIFAYIFLKSKKYILSTIAILSVIIVGARSGLVLLILAIFFGLKASITKKNIFVFFGFASLLSFIIFVFDYFNNNIILNQFSFYVNSFSKFDISQDLSSKETVGFTAYRSVIWLNALEELSLNWFSFTNIFGRGSLSSLDFNYDTLGTKVWMHNDFMDVIFNYGYLGLSIYLFTSINYFKSAKNTFGFLFFFIAAFTNGFLTYTPFQLLFLLHLSKYYPNNTPILK